jgi:hypothetical protein
MKTTRPGGDALNGDRQGVRSHQLSPGKRTLTQDLPVQQKLATGPSQAADVPAAAAQGVSGAAQELPHLRTIQSLFGRHDVTGVQSHTDDVARTANAQMGAEGFATGQHVAFASTSPSLHVAAHEAAHVVQQRAGVHLKGGVGEAGDAHEQHADRVADLVVAGKSAEPELSKAHEISGGEPSSTVQHKLKMTATRRMSIARWPS